MIPSQEELELLMVITKQNIAITEGRTVPESQEEYYFLKSLFKQPLFWSSPVDKMRKIDGVIEVYVKSPNIDDINTLVRLFGRKRVLSIAEQVYKKIIDEFAVDIALEDLPEFKIVKEWVQEPTSKAESIAILDEYKEQLTAEQYRNIECVIGHMAIEFMYCNRKIIDRAVRAEIGKITHEQEIEEALNKLDRYV